MNERVRGNFQPSNINDQSEDKDKDNSSSGSSVSVQATTVNKWAEAAAPEGCRTLFNRNNVANFNRRPVADQDVNFQP